MNAGDKKKLKEIVSAVADLEEKRAELADQVKELCAKAKSELGKDAKLIKQLAKEMNWDDIERMQQLQLEHELDDCRHALGFMVDLPLGRAAMERIQAAH